MGFGGPNCKSKKMPLQFAVWLLPKAESSEFYLVALAIAFSLYKTAGAMLKESVVISRFASARVRSSINVACSIVDASRTVSMQFPKSYFAVVRSRV